MVGMRPPRRLRVRDPGSDSRSRSPRLMRTSTARRTWDRRLRRGQGWPQQGQAGGASGPGAGGAPQRWARHARQKLCSQASSTGSSKGPPHSGHVASCARRSTSPGPGAGDSMGSRVFALSPPHSLTPLPLSWDGLSVPGRSLANTASFIGREEARGR